MSGTKGEDEGVRPTGKFRVYLGAAAGVGKTCAMLDEGWRRFQRGADVVVGFVETHKRPYTLEQIRDLPDRPAQAGGVPRLGVGGDGRRRRARPQTRGGADRRARPHQRARHRAPREALGGRARDPRCRHRGHLHGQHPAHRVPGRRGRADHRGRGPRASARLGGAAGRPDRAHRLLGRPAAPAHAARQHLPGEQGPVGAERVLPHREPGGAARALAALRRRRDRGGAPRVSSGRRRRGRRGVGDDRAHHGGGDRRTGQRRRDQAGGAHRARASRPT